jgi:hypothetical protein
MAGVAASLASTGRQAGRQAGTTLGVAISGTVIGSSLARGGTAYTNAEHGVWWLVLALRLSLLTLGLLSTGAWARETAGRAAAAFGELDRGRSVQPPPDTDGRCRPGHWCGSGGRFV